MKNIIIYNHDIQKYPPIISAIQILIENQEEVVVLGFCSNKELVDYYKDKGVRFVQTVENDIRAGKFKKLVNLIKFKFNIKKSVSKIADKNSLVWIYGNENAWLLHSLVSKYKCIVYLFEIPIFKVSLRYRLLSPFLRYGDMMRSAYRVICCEYNRAKITQSYFGLEKEPVVIPNKPSDVVVDNLIDPVLMDNITNNIPKNKKIILYQGIFNYPERRLDELCQATQFLSDEFVVCIMGGEDDNKRRLKEKHESERVIFLPYIQAPNHLLVTQFAYIGFMSYFASGGLESSLNTLFCAPNKIFEYSKFGIPMVSNDCPALKSYFDKFDAGIAVESFTPEHLAKAIIEIEMDYKSYSEGALRLYNSVDIENKILSIVRNVQ